MQNASGSLFSSEVSSSRVLARNTVDGQNPAPLGNHGKPFFVGIHRGIIILGFLVWCRILSIHSISGIHPEASQKRLAHCQVAPRRKPGRCCWTGELKSEVLRGPKWPLPQNESPGPDVWDPVPLKGKFGPTRKLGS